MQDSVKRLAVVALIVIFTFAGCDKITAFLSDYFPSLKKQGEAPQPTVTTRTATPSITGKTLARVGNWTITKEEFDEKLHALKELVPEYDTDTLESKRLVLEELIRQQLLVYDAEKTGIANKKEIVDAVEEFRRTLLVREVAVKITEDIDVSLVEAKEYYDQNKEIFAEPPTWHVREIVVPTQSEAKQILIELLQGADFAQTATARSKSSSAAVGGDLGFITEFEFPEMESAVSPLDVEGVSSVFKGPEGYYIIKLEEKRGGESQSFSEISEDIQAGLTLMKQQEAILAYIEQLKKQTTIEINEDLLLE